MKFTIKIKFWWHCLVVILARTCIHNDAAPNSWWANSGFESRYHNWSWVFRIKEMLMIRRRSSGLQITNLMSWRQHSPSSSSYYSSLYSLLILPLFNFRINNLHSSQFGFMLWHIQVKTIFGSYDLISPLFRLNILNIKTVVFWTCTFLLEIFQLNVLRWRLLNWVWKHQSIIITLILNVGLRHLRSISWLRLSWIIIWSTIQRSLWLLLLLSRSISSSAIGEAFSWKRYPSLIEIQLSSYSKSVCIIIKTIVALGLSAIFV